MVCCDGRSVSDSAMARSVSDSVVNNDQARVPTLDDSGGRRLSSRRISFPSRFIHDHIDDFFTLHLRAPSACGLRCTTVRGCEVVDVVVDSSVRSADPAAAEASSTFVIQVGPARACSSDIVMGR